MIFNFSKSYYDTDTLNRNTEDYTIERLDNGIWVGVAFQGAYGIDQYTVEVQTLVAVSYTHLTLPTKRIV